MKDIKEFIKEGLFSSSKKTFNDYYKEFTSLAQKTLDKLHIDAKVTGLACTNKPNDDGKYFYEIELFGKWVDKYLASIKYTKSHEVYYPCYASDKKINVVKDICNDKIKQFIEESLTKGLEEWIKRCEKNF